MQPFVADALYVNFTSDQDAAAIRSAYPRAVRERLVALKNRYDPANLFRVNHNIEPDGASTRLPGGAGASETHAQAS
jgi:Berberine and berberine like